MNNVKIIIIGCGASGLAAASRLFDNGYKNVTILEAENRIGGRIKSVNFGKGTVELGAQWCHGEKGNVAYDLVKDMKILEPSFNKYIHMDFYESNGKRIDKNITDKLCDIYLEVSDKIETVEDTHIPFGEYYIVRYNEKVNEMFANNNEFKKIAAKALDFFHKLTLCYDPAESWMDLLIPAISGYQLCEGDQLLSWGTTGYKMLLDVLMKKCPTIWQDKNILLNKEVNKIKWENSNNKCQVDCSDGSTYEADHVIVTVSLGVLKDKKQLFVPILPVYKRNAIDHIGFGKLNKIFLKFSKRWWPDDCPGFSLLWNNDDSMNILNEFPDGPSINGRFWLEDIFGFFPFEGESNTLMAWLVGPTASYVEKLSDEIVLRGCMFLLNKFLGNYYEILQPEEILRSDWNTNPHFLGTYSYRTVESENKRVYSSDIAEPLYVENNKPLVLFAGEATHPHYYSTVHGAIETGFREADRIIHLYRNLTSLQTFRSCKIAIIGAGMAGLGAAKTLIENGIDDVLILEGSHRAGGRVHTFHIGGSVIELGAQWLHSTTDSLYKLAKDNNLISKHYSDEGLGIYVRDDGYIYDDFLVRKVDFQIGKILEECESFVDREVYPSSVGAYLEKQFMEYLEKCEDSEDVKNMKLELFDWNVLFQIIDNSCIDLNKLSAKDWGKYTCLGKDGQKHMNIVNGYNSLVDLILKSLPNNILLLNKLVTQVDYSLINNDKIELKCQDQTIVSDYVIVTSSIGFLKDNEEFFCPPLPTSIHKNIKDIGFYGMGKVYLFFEYKWWDTEGYQLVWRRNVRLNGANKWIQYISGFDLVLGHENALMGWVGGEGVQLMEELNDQTVGIHCVDLLKRFLKRSDIPYPINVVKTNWLSNKLIRGAYSHATIECDASGSSPSIFCEPILVNGEPRLYLAGEAAHSNHFSTTHGAFESGQNQARKLLEFLQ